jgi:hypothetical protein
MDKDFIKLVGEFLDRKTSSERRKEIIADFEEQLFVTVLFALIGADAITDEQQVQLKCVKDYVNIRKYVDLVEHTVIDAKPRVLISVMVLIRNVPSISKMIDELPDEIRGLLDTVDMYEFCSFINEGARNGDNDLVHKGTRGVLDIYLKYKDNQASFFMTLAAVMVKFMEIDLLFPCRYIIRHMVNHGSLPEVLTLGMAIGKCDTMRLVVDHQCNETPEIPEGELRSRAESLATRFLEMVNEFALPSAHTSKEVKDIEEGDIIIPEGYLFIPRTMKQLRDNIQ